MKNIKISIFGSILLVILINVITINYNYMESLKTKDKVIQELEEENGYYLNEIINLEEELQAEKDK